MKASILPSLISLPTEISQPPKRWSVWMMSVTSLMRCMDRKGDVAFAGCE